jgi:hypothetical protein
VTFTFLTGRDVTAAREEQRVAVNSRQSGNPPTHTDARTRLTVPVSVTGLDQTPLRVLRRMFRFRENCNVKLSLYSPWRTSGLREVEAPTFSDIRLTDGGEVVSLTRRPHFNAMKIPGTQFC